MRVCAEGNVVDLRYMPMGCSAPPQYESDPENPTSAVGFFAIGDPILLERAAAGDHGFSNAKQQANACDVSFKSKVSTTRDDSGGIEARGVCAWLAFWVPVL